MDGTPPLLVNCLFPETHPTFSCPATKMANSLRHFGPAGNEVLRGGNGQGVEPQPAGKVEESPCPCPARPPVVLWSFSKEHFLAAPYFWASFILIGSGN